MRYFSNASVTVSGLTSPRSASARSAATATLSASTWKKRRAAGRVSAKPNPSVPNDYHVLGTDGF
uniref:hypothetical protein n=1 Tax=Listeria monocytogenes TaxID=1639 RepID=UPI001A7E6332